jgi:hypothetical protein
MHHSVKCIDVK